MNKPKNPIRNTPNKAGKKRAPDFYGIGAEKCGTTWLWEMLRDHPDVGVPMPKELRYFANRTIGTGLTNFTALQKLMKDHSSAPLTAEFMEKLATEIRIIYGGDPAYKGIFGQLAQKVVGDISPQYCMLPEEGIQKMKTVAPKAKIIMLLRDPVDRVISAGKMKASENDPDLTEDMVRDKALIPFQIRMSRYSTILDSFEKIFPKNHIFVGFMDDIKVDSLGLLNRICDFIDAPFDPKYFTRLEHIANEGAKFSVSPELRQELYETLSDEYDALENRFPEMVTKWRDKHVALNA